MRADLLPTMPPSTFKMHGSNLGLSLGEVKESGDEYDEMTKPVTNGLGTPNGHVTTIHISDTDDVAHNGKGSKKLRAPSATKRVQPNGHLSRSDSPLSVSIKVSSSSSSNSSTSSSGTPSRKPSPPKSAPTSSTQWRKRSVGPRTAASCRESSTSDGRTPSPSPPRQHTARAADSPPAGARGRGSGRPARKRLTSRSEDQTSSSGDVQSPRSSGSERANVTVPMTSSSDGSEDHVRPQLPSLPGSPLERGGGGGGGAGGRGSSPSPPTSAWDFFEEHVRLIHDSSDVGRQQGPSFQASDTFLETMTELYGSPEYSRPPTTGLFQVATRGLVVAGAASRFLKLRKRAGGPGAPVDRQTVEKAQRGWRVLRRHVQDTFSSRRTSQAALSWSMLRQTLKGMSDPQKTHLDLYRRFGMSDRQKTRLDLYRRYGIIPTVGPDGQPVMVNTMLSERAQQAIASGTRHPLLAHTAKSSSSSHDKTRSVSLSLLPGASSSSPQTSPRSSARSPRRRAQSSVAPGARADLNLRPQSTLSGTKLGVVGGAVSQRNARPLRKSFG